MALFSSNSASDLGSINVKVQTLIPVPPLPNIVAEWSALIPLVCHLASYRHSHILAGEIALNRRVSIGICPPLSVLAGIADMLRRGPDYMDQVSTKGGEGKRVWDVNWGTVFPCANGAASNFLAKFALNRNVKYVRMPEGIFVADKSHKIERDKETKLLSTNEADSDQSSKPASQPLSDSDSTCNSTIQTEATETLDQQQTCCTPSSSMSQSSDTEIKQKSAPTHEVAASPTTRRPQILHVLEFFRVESKSALIALLSGFLSSAAFEAAAFVFLVGVCLFLILVGAYGTASVLLCGALSQVVCRLISVQSPAGYLHNNESHDACMLVGNHVNANVWYLYVGDRGAVDWLLNKPMTTFGPRSSKLAYWFKFASILQLFGMTFTAAQKGWDGVSLLALIIVDWTLRWRFRPNHLAKRWLEAENFAISATTFEFTGRTPMIAAIQRWNGGKKTLWMNEIIPPSPRRDVLLDGLGMPSVNDVDIESLSPFDRRWVELNSSLALQAVRVLQAEVGASRRNYSKC